MSLGQLRLHKETLYQKEREKEGSREKEEDQKGKRRRHTQVVHSSHNAKCLH